MASSSIEKQFMHGFGFEPNTSEIVRLLKGKKSGCTADQGFQFIKIIELYNYTPEQLWEQNNIDCGNENNKYFFTQLDKKHVNGGVINRQIGREGYWKITRTETEGGVAKKSFAYHRTRAGKTQWLMKQYTLPEDELRNEARQWALCVVYKNRG